MKAFRACALLLAALWGKSALPSAATESLSGEVGRCAAIARPDARLACYDKLALRSADAAATQAMPAPASALGPAPAAVAASAVAAAAGTAAGVPPPGPAPAPAQDPAAAAQNFGLSSAQTHSAPQGPQSIEAHVAQVGMDRGLHSYLVLDNGQTWLSTDGGMELDSGEQVSIKRAALGSFMLVSNTSKHSYHVRRIR